MIAGTFEKEINKKLTQDVPVFHGAEACSHAVVLCREIPNMASDLHRALPIATVQLSMCIPLIYLRLSMSYLIKLFRYKTVRLENKFVTLFLSHNS